MKKWVPPCQPGDERHLPADERRLLLASRLAALSDAISKAGADEWAAIHSRLLSRGCYVLTMLLERAIHNWRD